MRTIIDIAGQPFDLATKAEDIYVNDVPRGPQEAVRSVYSGDSFSFFWGCGSLVAIVASTYLVRISRVHSRPGVSIASGQWNAKVTSRPGRLLWIVSIALLLLAGFPILSCTKMRCTAIAT